MSEFDDELAEATDALLNGRDLMPLQGENAELIGVVRQIYGVIDPRTPLNAAFQQRMTARLNTEWDRQHAPTTLRLLERPAMRLVALAAAVALVLGAIIVLSVPEGTPQLQGAAMSMNHGLALLVLLGAAVAGAYFYWRGRH